MVESLKLTLFGGFRADSPDGEAVDLSGKKVQALLAFLAAESASPQSRERLATLLWGDTGEERARHNLRQALSKIRRQCNGAVRSQGDCLQLDLSVCDTDVARFTELSGADDEAGLQACLDLYQGEFLDGLSLHEADFDDWLARMRDQYTKMACKVAARLAAANRNAGKTDAAIAACNALLEIDPAFEPAHRDLMVLYEETGRRSDALRQYQACVDALERELGASPGTETRQLHAQIRDADRIRAGASGGTADARTLAAPAPPSVAVLPFENLSGESDSYFADGITEDLITALSCFHSLVVIARGSSFAYRDRGMSEQAIANQLSAQYIVCGSVRRADSRVRINVQLLDADADMHVWGHRYDREIEDIFLLQDEITSTLVSTLAGRVEAARLAQARKAPPERLDAYDLLLRGKDHHHRYTTENCKLCIEMFERAVERDPSFAVAHAWLACGYGQAMVFNPDDAPTFLDKSQAAAEKSLELDEDESECHRILAQINLTRGNLERALWHQERGLLLNPNDDRLVCAMGEILAFVGRAEKAEEWVRKSMRLNPYHPPRYWTHLARALLQQRRYQEALAALENVGRARVDDLAYRVAATAALDDVTSLQRSVTELRASSPEFDPEEFAQSLPYQRDVDRQAVLEPLAAGLARVS